MRCAVHRPARRSAVRCWFAPGADRQVAADLARAAVLAAVPLMWWLGGLSMIQLYLVAMLTGIGTLLFDVAAQSIVPQVVGRDRLTAANSLFVSTNAAMDISGRSFAGVLVSAVGAPVAIALDALTYLWSAALIGRLRPAPTPPAAGERKIAEGLQFVFGHEVLRPILIMGTLANLGFPLFSALLPVLVVGQLGFPPWVLGLYLAVGGAGVLAGSATAHLVGTWLGRGRGVWIVSLATTPAALIVPVLGEGPWIWVSALAWFALTYRTGINNVLLVSFRQEVTPDAMLGRMTATMRLLLMGAVGIGGLLAGLLGEAWGVRAAMWTGAACAVASLVPLYFSPLTRKV